MAGEASSYFAFGGDVVYKFVTTSQYNGCHVGGSSPPTNGRGRDKIPFLMSEGEKYVFIRVSLQSTECHAGSLCSTSGGRVATGACFRSREKALHNVPKKGYVFHGMGPNCSQGRCSTQSENSISYAHA